LHPDDREKSPANFRETREILAQVAQRTAMISAAIAHEIKQPNWRLMVNACAGLRLRLLRPHRHRERSNLAARELEYWQRGASLRVEPEPASRTPTSSRGASRVVLSGVFGIEPDGLVEVGYGAVKIVPRLPQGGAFVF
jgi:hypothetical protein